jgi:acyl-CoA thioesterase YciA
MFLLEDGGGSWFYQLTLNLQRQSAMTEPMIRVVAHPKDANPDGDVFGGWILSLMDMAGAIPARKRARTRVVTIAVDQMKFLLPVYIGDCLECYATIERVGRTSMTVMVEAMVERREGGQRLRVTEGRFTYVAIDKNRAPLAVPAEA